MKYDTILHNKLLHNVLYIIDCYYHFNLFYFIQDDLLIFQFS